MGLSLDGTEFSVDPAYQLPQDCGLGDAATWTQTPVSLGEWGCQQFTYAGETCPTGQFARATDEHGGLVCAAPPTTGGDPLAIVFGRQVNPTQGNVPSESAGIPSDRVARTFASVSVPAGTYLVLAKGSIGSEHNADGFGETRCSIGADRVSYGGVVLDDDGFTGEFSLMEVIVSSGGTIGLECMSTFDGISLHQARITAIPFGG